MYKNTVFFTDMGSQRNDSEYLGSSSHQPTGVLGKQDHAGNSEIEKHDLETGTMYCFFVFR